MSDQSSQGTAVESSGVEPIVKTGSTSDLTSFDELEAVSSKPTRKAIDNSESKPKTKEPSEGKDSKEKTPKKAKEKDDSNDEEESDQDDSDKAQEPGQKDKEKPKQEEDSQGKLKPKVLKAKVGDQTIDLRSDAQFEVTINGQKQTVTAQELINEFSGKTVWQKKFSELDTDRKQFETNKKELEEGIQNWANLSKNDPIAAIEYVCEISGQDPRKFIQDIRSQFKQAFEEYAKLTPEEREQRELSDERDYYKSKAEKIEADRSKAREQTREKADLDKRIEAAIKKFSNLDKARFVSLYDELKTLKAQGAFDGEVTPELVGQYHQELEHHQIVNDAVREIAPDLQDKSEAIKELKSLWDKDPSLTVEDIKHIAGEVYGSDAAKRLAKKVKKSNPQPQTVSRPKISLNDPMFFDELD